jgi:hypothetical protein
LKRVEEVENNLQPTSTPFNPLQPIFQNVEEVEKSLRS